MLKYTVLYKNGKTWNGKAAHIDDLDLVVSDIVHITVKHSGGYTVLYSAHGPWYDKESLRIEQVHLTRHTSIPKVRTPNPNSKTKKQKAFEEDYEKWAAARRPEVYTWGSGHAEYSIQAYKKWLWEQKKVWWKDSGLGDYKIVLYTNNPWTDKDGFIPWAGGECPVQKDNKVVVKFRDGGSYLDTASVFCWYEMGSYGDIVGYKAVEEQPTVPVTPAEPYPYTVGSELEVMYQNELRKITCVAVNSFDSQWMLQPKQPIKTTYTFWLGECGEIIDDKRT